MSRQPLAPTATRARATAGVQRQAELPPAMAREALAIASTTWILIHSHREQRPWPGFGPPADCGGEGEVRRTQATELRKHLQRLRRGKRRNTVNGRQMESRVWVAQQ